MTIQLTCIASARSEREEVKDDWWGDVLSCVSDIDTSELSGHSHAYVVFQMNRVKLEKIESGARHPRNDITLPSLGIFAQRSKNHPNRLGISCAEIHQLASNQVVFRGLDVIDHTPILAIRPFTDGDIAKIAREPDWLRNMMVNYFKTPTANETLSIRAEAIKRLTVQPPTPIDVEPIGIAISHKAQTIINLDQQTLSSDCTRGLIENFSHAYLLYSLAGQSQIHFTLTKLIKTNDYEVIIAGDSMPNKAQILDIRPYSTCFIPHIDQPNNLGRLG